MKWEIKQFNEVSSTNTLARTMPIGTVVMAEAQTAGRGRYGRVWQSPIGNLYASFVFPNTDKLQKYLSFMTGLALAESLPEFDVHLKWPNDVLLDGKKLAGVLLETVEDKIIVGIGVNLVSSPTKNVLYPTTHLGGLLSPIALVKRLIIQYDAVLSILEKKGFEKIKQRWLDLAQNVGEIISVHLPDQELVGIFKGINNDGALILKTTQKTYKIMAGDVFLI